MSDYQLINYIGLGEQELLSLAELVIEAEQQESYVFSLKLTTQVEALSKKEKYKLLGEIFKGLARTC